MKLTKEIVLQKIKENKDKIKEFGVEEISIFGSYYTGENTEESDIDFLVKYKEGRGLFDDSCDLLHFLEDLFVGKKIDICEKGYVREELKKYINDDNAVGCEI
jgi:uncharacterized protein